MGITATRTADELALAAARIALEQVLPATKGSERRSWQESDYNGDAVVLAYDVSSPVVGRSVEELVGVAIYNGDGLHLQFRCGIEWQVTRPVGIDTPNPVEAIRERWREHPEAETLGEADGFVTYYATEPDDEQFDDVMTLSVAVGGNDIFRPKDDCVVVSLNGSTRLMNALIEPDEALRLAALLNQAATKVTR